jgi:cytochrome d ubiquinol oxidase subunit I
MEAIWETERGAPLLLFAWPDEKARENRFAIGIPRGASLILGHSLDAELVGLNEFRAEHPPVAPVFFAFRVMVGVGMLMLLTSWAGWWLLRRHGGAAERLPRPMLWTLTAMAFSGWVATLAGWYVTEIGRQPFIVFGLLRTADVVTSTPGSHVLLTLVGYVVVYAALIVSYVAVLKYMAEHVEETSAEKPGHSSEAVAAAAAGEGG